MSIQSHLHPTLGLLLLSLSLAAQPANLIFGTAETNEQFTQVISTATNDVLLLGSAEGQVQVTQLDSNLEQVEQWSLPRVNAEALEFGRRFFLQDDHLFILGEGRLTAFWENYAYLAKVRLDGHIVWRETFFDAIRFQDVVPYQDDFIVTGWDRPPGSNVPGTILRLNNQGQQIWKRPIVFSNRNFPQRLWITSEDEILVMGNINQSGNTSHGIFLQMLNADGDALWEQTHETGWIYRDNVHELMNDDDQPFAFTINNDQQTIWIAANNRPVGSGEQISLLQFSLAEGELLTEEALPLTNKEARAHEILKLSSGNFLIVGTGIINNPEDKPTGLAMLVTPRGFKLWAREYAVSSENHLLSAQKYTDESILMVGVNRTDTSDDAWLLWTPMNGLSQPGHIEGHVLVDRNNNCISDTDDLDFPEHWVIRAINAEDTVEVVSDASGKFDLPINFGPTELQLPISPSRSDYWEPCAANITVVTDGDNPSTEVYFILNPKENTCPPLDLSITNPDLVRCETSRFWININNFGLLPSEAQVLQIDIGDDFTFVDASTPVFQSGSILEIDLAAIPAFSRQSLYVDLQLDCQLLLGQAHTIKAQLTDAACSIAEPIPDFTVVGECDDSSVKFTIRNATSGTSPASSTYHIYGDANVIAEQQAVELSTDNDTHIITVPADGRTWRLSVNQVPEHPFSSIASAVIEGCGEHRNGLPSLYYSDAFPNPGSSSLTAQLNTPNSVAQGNRVIFDHEGLGHFNLTTHLAPIPFSMHIENTLDVLVDTIIVELEISTNLDLSTLTLLGGAGDIKWESIEGLDQRFTLSNLNLEPGEIASVKARISTHADIQANSQENSLFVISADAFLNGEVPPVNVGYDLINYSDIYPNSIDTYYDYGPEVLRFGGKSYDFGFTLSVTESGDVFAAGRSNSFGFPGQEKGLLIKTNSTGHAYWQEAIALERGENCTIKGVAPTPDGGCLIAGYMWPAETGNFTIYASIFYGKVDAQGKLLWHQRLRPHGEENYAIGQGIVPTADGGGIVFGYAKTGPDYDTDPVYIKLDSEGQIEWTHQDIVINSALRPQAGTLLADGSVVFVGENLANPSLNYDTFLQQVMPDGTTGFQSGYNSEHFTSYLSDIAAYDDGSGLLVAGYSQWEITPLEFITTPTLIKFSNTGAFLWERNLVLEESVAFEVASIIPTGSNDFYIGGAMFVDTNLGWDAALARISSEADLEWVQHYGNTNAEIIQDLTPHPENGIILWGFNQARPPLYTLESLMFIVDSQGDNIVSTDEPLSSKGHDILLFPNPAHTAVQVALSPSPNKEITYDLYDVNGRRVDQGIIPADGLITIPVSQIANGMYFLRCHAPNYPAKYLVISR